MLWTSILAEAPNDWAATQMLEHERIINDANIYRSPEDICSAQCKIWSLRHQNP